mgnify:CR=1 FL=1|jgi:hypothetical protein
MAKAKKNIIGAQLSELRRVNQLSQEELAAICRDHGWQLTRDVLARMETHVRCVADFELLLIADILKVPVTQILPPPGSWKQIRKDYLR